MLSSNIDCELPCTSWLLYLWCRCHQFLLDFIFHNGEQVCKGNSGHNFGVRASDGVLQTTLTCSNFSCSAHNTKPLWSILGVEGLPGHESWACSQLLTLSSRPIASECVCSAFICKWIVNYLHCHSYRRKCQDLSIWLQYDSYLKGSMCVCGFHLKEVGWICFETTAPAAIQWRGSVVHISQQFPWFSCHLSWVPSRKWKWN